MFIDINYIKMKKLLLKEFKGSRIYIEQKGILNTRFWIDKSKILLNHNKLIIANDDIDCTILLDFIKKVKISNAFRIELIAKDEQFILEI